MNIQFYKNKFRQALQDKHFGFVLKGSLSTAVTLFFVQGLRFISGVLIGRFYGAEASGRLTLIVTVMGIFYIFINFGIKEALQKLIPEYREKYNLKSAYTVFLKGNILVLYFSVIAAIVLYFVAPWLCAYWDEPDMVGLFRLSGLFLPFFVLGDLNYFSLRAALKIHTANMSLVVPTIIRLLVLLGITFYFFHPDNPIYLHWGTLCLLPWLFTLWPVYRYFHQPSAAETKQTEVSNADILSVAFPMLMTYAAFLVSNSADVFILKSNHVATNLVGVYKTCTNVSMLAATLLVALNTTVQPKMTQLYTQKNTLEVQRIACKSAKLVFYLSLPVFVLLLFFSKQVMWLYGKDFSLGALSLSIMTLGQVFNTVCGPVAQLLNATGYHKQFRNISLMGAVLNILLNLLFIPHWGIEGAAAANAISMIFWNVTGAIYIKKTFGFYIVYIPFVNLNKKA